MTEPEPEPEPERYLINFPRETTTYKLTISVKVYDILCQICATIQYDRLSAC